LPEHESGVTGNFELGRVAVDEHRYVDTAECRKAAILHHGNNHDPGPNGRFRRVSSSPLIFAWKAEKVEVEIRFVALPASEVQQPGETLQYKEITKQSGNYKKDIDDAISELEKKRKWKLAKKPVEDSIATNGKKAWRAVMKKPPLTVQAKSTEAAMMIMREDEVGLIINPPYP
jgi:hypothetical protein